MIGMRTLQLGNGSKKFRNPALPPSYLGDVVRCYGKEIDLVGQPLGGLHRGNVGVDQQRLDVFLLQGLDCLGRRNGMSTSTAEARL